jgi:hypothetical protein
MVLSRPRAVRGNSSCSSARKQEELFANHATSAAAPVFAAMIALLNNERFNQGKPSMGFLNPWIYSIGHIGFTE